MCTYTSIFSSEPIFKRCFWRIIYKSFTITDKNPLNVRISSLSGHGLITFSKIPLKNPFFTTRMQDVLALEVGLKYTVQCVQILPCIESNFCVDFFLCTSPSGRGFLLPPDGRLHRAADKRDVQSAGGIQLEQLCGDHQSVPWL